jgi:predicted O-methyltransferase YrrM
MFHLHLGPVLSDYLAVKHLLIFVSFCLVCLLLPRLTHAVMVLSLPVIIMFLTIPLWSGRPFEFNFWEFAQDDSALFKWTIQRAHYSYTWHSWSINALHFIALFVAAMVCHGELARTRPSTRYLTAFYLCMSIGGVLGGLFNGIVAPIAFSSLVEYPLVIALACLLVPRLGLAERGSVGRWVDLLVPAAVFAFGLVTAFVFLAREVPIIGEFARFQMKRLPDQTRERYQEWEWEFGRREASLLQTERGFFGIVRVRRKEYDWSHGYPYEKWQGKYHYMQHGNIDHGLQRLEFSPEGECAIYAPLVACSDPLDAALTAIIRAQVRAERRRDEPIAYFQQSGPIGDIFAAARAKKKNLRIGVLGMGTGTLAGYAQPGWQIDYYEIDPAVVRIAYNEEFFTYLPDAERRGVKVEKFLGDGRLQIQKNAPDHAYDLLFMDAFSSDSVPVHLLTKEAIEMYLQKLAPGGIIIVNIANRYLDFRHIFGNLAEDLGLASLYGWSVGDDPAIGEHADLYGCDWVLLAPRQENFGLLNDLVDKPNPYKGWKTLPVDHDLGVWTDDFSNLLSVFNWNR